LIAMKLHAARPPRDRIWIVFVIAALMGLAGALLARTPADRTIFIAVNEWGARVPVIASALSVLGLGAAMFVLSGVIGLRRPDVPAAVLLTLLVGGLAVHSVKLLAGASRPLAALGPDTVHVIGSALRAHSMPSGHAAAYGAVAAMVWTALWPGGPAWRRWALAAPVTVLAVAGALARVVVGAHWPSDLLVGAALGAIAGTLVVATQWGRLATRWLSQRLMGRVGAPVMAVLLLGTSVALWKSLDDYPLAAALYVVLAVLGVSTACAWWWFYRRTTAGKLGSRPWDRSVTEA
jgi:membrane-associated phospholipid phosphatase